MSISREAAANAQANTYIRATIKMPQITLQGMVEALNLNLTHIKDGLNYRDFAFLEFAGDRMRYVRTETAKAHRELGVANVPNLDRRNAFAWETIRSGVSHGLALLARGSNDRTLTIGRLSQREVAAAATFLSTESGLTLVTNIGEAALRALESGKVRGVLSRYRDNTVAISQQYKDVDRNDKAAMGRKETAMNQQRGMLMGTAAPAVTEAVVRAAGGRAGAAGFAGAITSGPGQALFNAYK